MPGTNVKQLQLADIAGLKSGPLTTRRRGYTQGSLSLLCYLFSVYKPGSCPNLNEVGCSSNCGTDYDCGGPNKCCFVGCGKRCVDPVPGEK